MLGNNSPYRFNGSPALSGANDELMVRAISLLLRQNMRKQPTTHPAAHRKGLIAIFQRNRDRTTTPAHLAQ